MNAMWRSLTEASADDLPPSPKGWADDDALVFDPTRGQLVYLRSADHHQHAEVWALGEEGEWSKVHDPIQVEVEQAWVGFWDAGRGGVVCWTGKYDHVAGARLPVGLLIGADGPEVIETRGRVEVPEPPTLRDRSAIFGYDAARERTVMITPRRIYALDSEGTWEREYVFGAGEIAPKWRNTSSSRAVWDHAGKRLIVSVFDDEVDELRLYTWDGATFAPLTQAGLPSADAFYDHWKASGFALASSPTQGVVLVLGEPLGTWRLGEDGKGWSRVATSNEPMRANDVEAAFDERDGSLWLGPGPYALVPGERTRPQHLMFRMHDARWSRLGRLDQKSPTDINNGAALAAHEGSLFVLTRHYEALTLRVAGSGRCDTLVDEAAAKLARASLGLEDRVVVEAAAVDAAGALHAFFRDGAVARWDGSAWSLVCGASPKVFKTREEFIVGWDHAAERFVAWGGKVNKRASPTTLYLLESGWAKEKKSSPRPTKRRADGVEPRWQTWALTYDPTERAMLRVGFADVALLRDGVWEPHAPKGYEVFHESFPPLPVYDVEREEVLLLDRWGRGIWRLDYGELERVGEMTYHDAMQNPDRGTYERVPAFLIRTGCHAWDHASGAVMVQGEKSALLQFDLRLGEVFEAARASGARTSFEAAHASALEAEAEAEAGDDSPAGVVRLYDPVKHRFWFGDIQGAGVRKREGNVLRYVSEEDIKETSSTSKNADKAQASLDKLESSRANKGYVRANALEPSALAWYFASEIDVLEVGEEVEDESDPWLLSTFGGSPRGLSKSKWPKRADGVPMGHLFSVANFGVSKARVISVFVPHDGDPFKPGTCVALPRTEAQTQRGPSPAPAGVPVIEAFSLESDTQGAYEFYADKLAFFTGEDSAMAEAVAAWRPTVKVDDAIRSKVNGQPRWVDEPVAPLDPQGERYRFYAQLDLTTLPAGARAALDAAWPQAELGGVVYLFLSPDEKSAEAIWQRP